MTKSGEKFWSGAKRFPTAAMRFDPNDPFHVMFVTATANILAAAYGIVPAPENEKNLLPKEHKFRSIEYINSIVRSLPVPEYIPEKIEADPAAPAAAGADGACAWLCVFVLFYLRSFSDTGLSRGRDGTHETKCACLHE